MINVEIIYQRHTSIIIMTMYLESNRIHPIDVRAKYILDELVQIQRFGGVPIGRNERLSFRSKGIPNTKYQK